jgi:hypothetical protein
MSDQTKNPRNPVVEVELVGPPVLVQKRILKIVMKKVAVGVLMLDVHLGERNQTIGPRKVDDL